jgi:hypothetical protein
MLDLRREIHTLKDELDSLALEESTLDDYIRHMQDTLAATQDFESNREYCYLTHDDIRRVSDFENKIIIAIKAPKSSTLEVPDPQVMEKQEGMKQEEQMSYQAILKSSGGPIDVFVISNGQLRDNASVQLMRVAVSQLSLSSLPLSSEGPGGAVDAPHYDNPSSFAFPASASNSPLHPPPMSPVIAQPPPGTQAMLGMASVPSSPFALTTGSPYDMLTSPNLNHAHTQSVYAQHALAGHTQSQAALGGGASPMHDLSSSSHHPSHSPPALVPGRIGSPLHRFGYGVGSLSPFAAAHSGSPFRPGMQVHAASPYGLHAHHSHATPSSSSAPPSGLLKLEPPSNDPDYFMNLEENEGLTDLYAGGQRGNGTASDGSKPLSSSSQAENGWPSNSPADEDNIFAQSGATSEK